ncbi:MAG: hypothetical protein BGN91_00155 [Nitrobacter sp. 62-13]|nr:MAG: hypothetical protein BGN91_00155 [Nitrobacter sp. 62-13]
MSRVPVGSKENNKQMRGRDTPMARRADRISRLGYAGAKPRTIRARVSILSAVKKRRCWARRPQRHEKSGGSLFFACDTVA